MVDIELSVDQSDSHGDDRRPRHGRGGGPRLEAHFGRRFANDFDGPNQRKPQYQICVEIAAPSSVDETQARLSGLDHVADSNIVVRSHTELRLFVRPRRGNGGSNPARFASPPFAHSRAKIIPARSPLAPASLASLAARIRPVGLCRYPAEPRPSRLSRTATIAGCDDAGKEKPTPRGRGTKPAA